MTTRDIKGKILSLFELQSPSLQVSCFKVLPNVFKNEGEFVLNLKYYGELVDWIIIKPYLNYI
jgi:hypothetical protein